MSVTPPPGGPDDHAVARVFGALLMAVGVLIMALCGLCTLAAFGFSMADGPNLTEAITLILPMAAIFGGVPAAVGFGLFALGRNLRKKGD